MWRFFLKENVGKKICYRKNKGIKININNIKKTLIIFRQVSIKIFLIYIFINLKNYKIYLKLLNRLSFIII